jgi:hypothetical protein
MQRNDDPARRDAVNGAAGALDTFEAAAAQIAPPRWSGIMGKKQLAIWCMVIGSRARDEWSDHDLLVAARVVHNTIDLIGMRKKLRRAGFLDAKGARHPLEIPAAKLASEIRSDARLLGLSARLQNGDPGDLAPKRRAEREARKVIGEISADAHTGLLA